MAYAGVMEKTVSTLLEFAIQTKDEKYKLINISRSDLAHSAGISTESFIRSLSRLKKKS
ncbi:helix-turn-helix domain-containing protein [Salegentibacter sp. UBA1130]|uniref:helix-turn-helix domain-containing protein n=1 Tax=Salegentibacter sp. UBA1130 TaxID=1947451 RepID=UPI00257BBBF1|nr:helix-turn-helix domain-containing protein [Salegentibacter sp. UBA1130]